MLLCTWAERCPPLPFDGIVGRVLGVLGLVAVIVLDGNLYVGHDAGDEAYGVGGKALLHLVVLLAVDGLVVLAAKEDGLRAAALLQAVRRKAVVALVVFGLQDQARQAAELPRAFAHGDVRRVPGRPLPPLELGRGACTVVAQQGQRVLRQRPLRFFRGLFATQAADVARQLVQRRHPPGGIVLERLFAPLALVLVGVLGYQFGGSAVGHVGSQDGVGHEGRVAVEARRLPPDVQPQGLLHPCVGLAEVGQGIQPVLHGQHFVVDGVLAEGLPGGNLDVHLCLGSRGGEAQGEEKDVSGFHVCNGLVVKHSVRFPATKIGGRGGSGCRKLLRKYYGGGNIGLARTLCTGERLIFACGKNK